MSRMDPSRSGTVLLGRPLMELLLAEGGVAIVRDGDAQKALFDRGHGA